MKISDRQLTVGEILTHLKNKEPDTGVRFDFGYFSPGTFHSYRGYYEDLAVEYVKEDCTVEQLRNRLQACLGTDFYGWKGGTFTMYSDTPVWVANSGEACGVAIVDVIDHGWRLTLKTELIDH